MNVAGIEALLADVAAVMADNAGRSDEGAIAAARRLYADEDAAGLAVVFAGDELTNFWAPWRHRPPVHRERDRAAVGAVTLVNEAREARTFEPGDLTIEHAATAAVYMNTGGGTLPARGRLVLPVEALVPGEAGTAAPGELTVLDPPIAGVRVTNDAAVIGADGWTDAEYRTALLSPDELSRAARAARFPSGALIGATRAREVATSGRAPRVHVAGMAGAITNPTQLRALRSAMRLSADPAPAENRPITIDVDLTVNDVLAPSNGTLTSIVVAALAAHVPTIPFGGRVYVDALDTVARVAFGVTARRTAAGGFEVDPEVSYVTTIAVTAPAADVVLRAAEVATIGAINVSITRV